MYRFYPLLFYTGLAGMLSLLGLSASRQLSRRRATLTAAWLSLLTLIWLLVPPDLHWLFSLWSPLPVLRGALLVDLTPALWRLGAVLGLAMSGVAWVEASERRHSSSVGGALALLLLLTLWLLISGGSLLLTLTGWAVFDLLLSAELLINGGEGEQVSFTLMLNGFTTLLLWAAALLARQEGVSTLWWVMWPLPSIHAALMVAAAVRMGLYPFQLVVLHRQEGSGVLLRFATAMQPLLGIVLLARLLMMPGALPMPRWFLLPALASLFLGGWLAWMGAEKRVGRYALYGVMGAVATAAFFLEGAWLLAAAGVWVAVMALVLVYRGVDREHRIGAWPMWMGMLFLLGVPPSPLGDVYRLALVRLPWIGRALFFVGLTAVLVPLLRASGRPALACTLPPWPQQRMAWGVGLGLGVIALGINGLLRPPSMGGVAGWALWVVLTVSLAWFSRGWKRARWDRLRVRSFFDLLELRWLYRALWRGWDHMLAVVRAAAEIVEGRGALIWSLLIVLITLLMAVKR